MGILLKHVWRNIKSNIVRSILIVLSIALAAAVFYVDLGIRKDIDQSTDQVLSNSTYGYDIAINNCDHLEELTLPECQKKLSFRLDYLETDGKKIYLFSGNVATMVQEGLVKLGDKHIEFSFAEEGQIYMTKTKALYMGVELGEDLSINYEGMTYTMRLTSYIADLGPFDVGEQNSVQILTSQEDVTPTFLYLSLKNKGDVDRAVSDLRAQDASLDISVLSVKKSNNSLGGISDLLVVLLALVMVIAFYIDASAQSLIIDYRIPVFAAFRSVGATQWATNGILILENVVYSFLSSVVGVVIGVFLHNAVLTYIDSPTISLDVVHALYTVLFSMAVSIFVALFSLLRIRKKSVKELLFHKQVSATKPSGELGAVGAVFLVLAFVFGLLNHSYNLPVLYAQLVLCVLGGSFVVPTICAVFSKHVSSAVLAVSQKTPGHKGGGVWLGFRNLGVNKINRSSAVLVAMVMALVFMIYIVVSSINGFFASYANNYPYELVIKRTTGNESTYSFLLDVDGVDGVDFEYWGYCNPEINGEGERVCFVAIDGTSNGVEIEEQYSAQLSHGGAIVDKAFAQIHGYTLGDELRVKLDGREFTLSIVGYCESAIFNTSRSSIVMTRADFFEYVKDNPAIIGIHTARDIEEMKTVVADAIAAHKGYDHSIRSAAEIVDSEMGETMDAVATLSVLPVLAVLLAFVGLVNNELISFNQKRKLYAMLYSSAMSRAQLSQMMLSELAGGLAVGGVFGMILSVWLTHIIRDIIFISLMYLPITVQPITVIMALLLLAVLLGLTSIFPLSRLKKLDIVQEVKYE